MRKFYGIQLILTLVGLATVLSACPPLNHKIFVRNFSADTARLILIYNPPFDTISNKKIGVRSANDIVPIKRKSFSRLNDTFPASADSGHVALLVPPNSTVFVSDILNSFYMFADKSLVIELAGKSDTMTANYPYKQLEGFKHKLDPAYNYFCRTVVYYDIR